MKTFEEKFTAWVDGELKGDELAGFQVELAKVGDAELEKLAAHQLGDLLREHGQAPELKNADFFNHQLMQQVETGNPVQRPAPARSRFFWSLGRIAAGAFSLLMVAGVCYYTIPGPDPKTGPAADTAQVFDTHTGSPEITASSFYSQQHDVTVVWLEGMKTLPAKGPKAEKSPQKSGKQ